MFSELSKALGAEETVEYEGKLYKLAPPDRLEVVAAWEEWLGDQALDFLLHRLARLGANGMTNALEATAKMYAEGKFDFMGEVSNQRLFTLEGQKKFVGLRLKLMDATVTDDMVKRVVEGRWEHLARVLMKEQVPDPNAEPPASTTPAAGENSGGEPSLPDSSSTTNAPSTTSAS